MIKINICFEIGMIKDIQFYIIRKWKNYKFYNFNYNFFYNSKIMNR